MSKPTLLAFNLHGERAGRIRLMASRYGIQYRPVKPEEYNQPLSTLCGQGEPGEGVYEGPGFEEEMLYMAYFPGGLVHKLLDSFRQQRMPSVKLKAMMTESNQAWDALELHRNLMEEAEQFRQMKAFAHAKKEQEAQAPQGQDGAL